MMDRLFTGFVCTFIAVVFVAVISWWCFLGYTAYQVAKDPAYYAHGVGQLGKALKDGFDGN